MLYFDCMDICINFVNIVFYCGQFGMVYDIVCLIVDILDVDVKVKNVVLLYQVFMCFVGIFFVIGQDN